MLLDCEPLTGRGARIVDGSPEAVVAADTPGPAGARDSPSELPLPTELVLCIEELDCKGYTLAGLP